MPCKVWFSVCMVRWRGAGWQLTCNPRSRELGILPTAPRRRSLLRQCDPDRFRFLSVLLTNWGKARCPSGPSGLCLFLRRYTVGARSRTIYLLLGNPMADSRGPQRYPVAGGRKQRLPLPEHLVPQMALSGRFPDTWPIRKDDLGINSSKSSLRERSPLTDSSFIFSHSAFRSP